MTSNKFDYPNKLQKIFDKLNNLNLKVIIVGGYVRDQLLGIPSKDIDIEIYNIDSFEELEKLLIEFGDVNSVGKSFGVCKLKLDDLDIDFSLPRSDSKIQEGHKGFDVSINSQLNFKTAASRRDFTINAIGYDVHKLKLLDPYNGIKDLEKKILKAVDTNKFAQDPLRILRAVGFATRFELKIDKTLFTLLKVMVKEKLLDQLPKERIFVEIEKFLTKSKKPSKAFEILQDLQAKKYFFELYTLSKVEYLQTLSSLDKCESKEIKILLVVLTHKMTEIEKFLLRFIQSQKLIKYVLRLVHNQNTIQLNKLKPYDIYKLATQVNISEYLFFLKAIRSESEYEQIQKLQDLANKLNIMHSKLPVILTGKDLIAQGLKPSKEFSKILDRAYEAQMRGEFKDKEGAIKWLQSVVFT